METLRESWECMGDRSVVKNIWVGRKESINISQLYRSNFNTSFDNSYDQTNNYEHWKLPLRNLDHYYFLYIFVQSSLTVETCLESFCLQKDQCKAKHFFFLLLDTFLPLLTILKVERFHTSKQPTQLQGRWKQTSSGRTLTSLTKFATSSSLLNLRAKCWYFLSLFLSPTVRK